MRQCKDLTDEQKVVKVPLLVLEESCDSCVQNKGRWCRRSLNSQDISVCIEPETVSQSCNGKAVDDCKQVPEQYRKTSFPQLPQGCDECIKLGTTKWCAHTASGRLLKYCVLKEMEASLCFQGKHPLFDFNCQSNFIRRSCLPLNSL